MICGGRDAHARDETAYDLGVAGDDGAGRYEPGQVVVADLVDLDTEAAIYGYNGGYPGPLLALGLAGVIDTFGPGVRV